jgi:hypothetical protein
MKIVSDNYIFMPPAGGQARLTTDVSRGQGPVVADQGIRTPSQGKGNKRTLSHATLLCSRDALQKFTGLI